MFHLQKKKKKKKKKRGQHTHNNNFSNLSQLISDILFLSSFFSLYGFRNPSYLTIINICKLIRLLKNLKKFFKNKKHSKFE